MAARARCALLHALLVLLALACASERVGSIGAVLSRDNETGALYVRDLPPGLAEHAELLPGDEILMVDGRYVRELKTPEIRKLLRGEVGSSVDLTVVRGEEVRRIRVKRLELREASEARPRVETLAE